MSENNKKQNGWKGFTRRILMFDKIHKAASELA